MSTIRITGTLARDAELRYTTSGGALLVLEINQSVGRLAVQAVRQIGSSPSAHIAAHSTARQLRRGTRVTVHAAQFDIVHWPTPHLVLLDVDTIEHQPLAPRYGVPA